MEMPAVGENSKKILIVEDNDDNRDILVYRLKSLGAVDVLEARNGKEALEIAAQSRPSLIFMDLKMPVMDGLTATRAIRQEEWGREIYIIALTAHAMNEEKDKALEAGCNDLITKPITDYASIKKRIEELLK